MTTFRLLFADSMKMQNRDCDRGGWPAEKYDERG